MGSATLTRVAAYGRHSGAEGAATAGSLRDEGGHRRGARGAARAMPSEYPTVGRAARKGAMLYGRLNKGREGQRTESQDRPGAARCRAQPLTVVFRRVSGRRDKP